jgi:hypothetical protein
MALGVGARVAARPEVAREQQESELGAAPGVRVVAVPGGGLAQPAVRGGDPLGERLQGGLDDRLDHRPGTGRRAGEGAGERVGQPGGHPADPAARVSAGPRTGVVQQQDALGLPADAGHVPVVPAARRHGQQARREAGERNPSRVGHGLRELLGDRHQRLRQRRPGLLRAPGGTPREPVLLAVDQRDGRVPLVRGPQLGQHGAPAEPAGAGEHHEGQIPRVFVRTGPVLERTQTDEPCGEARRFRVEQRASAVQPCAHRFSPWGPWVRFSY